MQTLLTLLNSQRWLALCVVLCLSITTIQAQTTEANETPAASSRGVDYEIPTWFKESFLDIAEDVAEADAAGKHVLLFFHLNNCPYCERMLSESFEQEPLKSFIQQNFDSIAINIRGDREIAFDADTTLTEKELADALKVSYTPTILFLDTENKAVARLNGYRSAASFKPVLEYVQSKAYQDGSLADYLAKQADSGVYQLREHKSFKDIKDLSTVKTPLMVIFEDSNCDQCKDFHDKLLARDDVQTEMNAFTVVRLDAQSTEALTTPDGTASTPQDWARQIDMTYRPGVVLFDEGKEVQRIDNLLYSFHFKEILRYVGGQHYKKQDFREYMRARQDELRNAGEPITITD